MMSVLRLFMRHFAIAAVLLVFALGAFVGGMARPNWVHHDV